MTSLTTVYFLSILLVSVAGMGSVFIANKVNPHLREDEAVPTPTPPPSRKPTPTPESVPLPNTSDIRNVKSYKYNVFGNQKVEKHTGKYYRLSGEKIVYIPGFDTAEVQGFTTDNREATLKSYKYDLLGDYEIEEQNGNYYTLTGENTKVVVVPEHDIEVAVEGLSKGRCEKNNPELYDFIKQNYNSLFAKSDSELIQDFGLKLSDNKVITKFSDKTILKLLLDCHPDQNTGDKNTENIAKILNRLKDIPV